MKALFVDFDGTLVDAIPFLKDVYYQFLSSHGKEGSEEEFSSLVGPSLPTVVETLKQTHHIKSSHAQLLEEYQCRIQEGYAEKVLVYPNAIKVLEELRNSGILIALVTSAPEELVNKYLLHHNIKNLFDAILTSEGLSESKPHPAIYQRALQTFQLLPNDALAIEDSPNGVKAAVGAGIFTLYLGGEGGEGYREVKDWLQIRGECFRLNM